MNIICNRKRTFVQNPPISNPNSDPIYLWYLIYWSKFIYKKKDLSERDLYFLSNSQDPGVASIISHNTYQGVDATIHWLQFLKLLSIGSCLFGSLIKLLITSSFIQHETLTKKYTIRHKQNNKYKDVARIFFLFFFGRWRCSKDNLNRKSF